MSIAPCDQTFWGHHIKIKVDEHIYVCQYSRNEEEKKRKYARNLKKLVKNLE